MDSLAVEARDLKKSYRDVTAVSGISFEVRRGEIFGLVGADGAGKTTTLQMLCTLARPSAGVARVMGFDTVKEMAKIRQKIGYMSEHFVAYPTLTVEENLDFFARLRNVPDEVAGRRKRELLAFSRLEPFRRRLAEHLSGGMQKKLALCCSLLHEPEVIFLDEPTNGVDPVSRRDFWLIISQFRSRGITFVISTPYMDEAERFSRVALMHRGGFIDCDTPANLKTRLSGELLTAATSSAGKALAALRQAQGLISAQVFGSTVHLMVDDAARRLPEIVRRLGEQGVPVENIHESPPSLEDVFVAQLTRGSESLRSPTGRATPGHSTTVSLNSEGPGIVLSELTRKFGSFTAVDRVSLEVRRGEIFGFLGPNGSGKTTTIRMLCGLLRPTSGKGFVLGQDIAAASNLLRTNIGYMSQKFSLFRDLTVKENIRFYAGLYSLSATTLAEREKWVLEMAGLAGKDHLLVPELSAGWKQRLALGCAIIHDPPVVFLDEPTAGVDPLSRRLFWELIQELADRGTTVFVTTHYMDEAEHCHRVGLMHQGSLIAVGSPLDLRTGQMTGRLLEVRCGDMAGAVQLLMAEPAYRQVGFFGDSLHLVMDRATKPDALRVFLQNNGIAVESIQEVPFTMEDVFVSLIEERERAVQHST